MKERKYHSVTHKLIVEKKLELEKTQRDLKSTIARINKAHPQTGATSGLMKLSNKIRIQINDLEFTLKVLKKDAQDRLEWDWKFEQAEKSFKAQQNSYNCLGGC
jgi:hypothetical protein